MQRILFVYRRPSSFVEIDLDLLRERWAVTEQHVSSRVLNPFAIARQVWRSDIVFGWFAYWHTFLPVTFAWLMRKPSVLVIGGYDTAADAAAGYGLQRGGIRQWISRWTMRRATTLIVNSRFTHDEAVRNAGVPAGKLTVVYHGVPDMFEDDGGSDKQGGALTVGVVDQRNLVRKGLEPFGRAAALLPAVEFVIAGRDDGAADKLRQIDAQNLRITGWVEDDELQSLYKNARVYVQASTHEGFGMSVAEAMLAGCVPVTTKDGALPEVVGDTGIQLETGAPDEIAAAIERGLEAGPDQRRRARRRVLDKFTIDGRKRGIHGVVEMLLSRRS